MELGREAGVRSPDRSCCAMLRNLRGTESVVESLKA